MIEGKDPQGSFLKAIRVSPPGVSVKVIDWKQAQRGTKRLLPQVDE